jgi:hypothetical protein
MIAINKAMLIFILKNLVLVILKEKPSPEMILFLVLALSIIFFCIFADYFTKFIFFI